MVSQPAPLQPFYGFWAQVCGLLIKRNALRYASVSQISHPQITPARAEWHAEEIATPMRSYSEKMPKNIVTLFALKKTTLDFIVNIFSSLYNSWDSIILEIAVSYPPNLIIILCSHLSGNVSCTQSIFNDELCLQKL